jgi:hypothetical protein
MEDYPLDTHPYEFIRCIQCPLHPQPGTCHAMDIIALIQLHPIYLTHNAGFGSFRTHMKR